MAAKTPALPFRVSFIIGHTRGFVGTLDRERHVKDPNIPPGRPNARHNTPRSIFPPSSEGVGNSFSQCMKNGPLGSFS